MSNYSTDTESGATALTGVLIALFIFLAIAFLAGTAPDMASRALAASNHTQTVTAALDAHQVS